MHGIVLAAGGGTRLRPLTDEMPKTLLPVTTDGRSVLELAVDNLSQVGVTEIAVVTGHAAHTIDALAAMLEQRYAVTLELRYNTRYETWNNAYSVWLVRDIIDRGSILINGDTVHPVSVEKSLMSGRGSAPILVAIDDDKSLGEEEMKVQIDGGLLTRISKSIEPVDAAGEYIGVTLFEPGTGHHIADALQATFERDTSLYYEDGYQEYVDRGSNIRGIPIGVDVPWVEVDDHTDLRRARELTAHRWPQA